MCSRSPHHRAGAAKRYCCLSHAPAPANSTSAAAAYSADNTMLKHIYKAYIVYRRSSAVPGDRVHSFPLLKNHNGWDAQLAIR